MNSQRLVANVLMIVIGAIAAFAIPAVFIWIATFIGDPESPLVGGTPFTLAQVMAIFGAFGLAGGFGSQGTAKFRRSLRLVATLFLISALCFSLLGMLFPGLASAEEGTTSTHVLVGALIGALALAGLAFLAGTVLWMSLVPELLCERGHAEAAKDSPSCH